MFRIAFVLAMVFLAGCATNKEWTATGGSRSDGVVRLSYDYGPMEVPKLQEQQAIDLASKRCGTWGYSGAEAFGGVTRTCNLHDGFGGCNQWLVTKEFQCTGSASPPKN